MNSAAKQKLEVLRADYCSVVGQPFNHFYCPILFRDEVTSLCRGHIINSGFRNSDRTWTIQRKDVDNFFGSFAESDFLALQERGKHNLLDILINKELSRLLKPRIVLDGETVEHFIIPGPVPQNFSPVRIERSNGEEVKLALKMTTEETLGALQGNWQIGVEKDIRVAALASLLKAAHLTCFELLGYRYALSAGGYFLGNEVLGKFYLANSGKSKQEVIANARSYFRQFAQMARPILAAPEGITGTITDRQLLLCTGTPKPWALLTFVRTEAMLHGVLVPIFEEPDGAARFVSHLTHPSPRIEMKLATFANDRWEVSPTAQFFEWPEAKFEWSDSNETSGPGRDKPAPGHRPSRWENSEMNKENLTNITATAISILSWIFFVTYVFCTRHEIFFTDHNSSLWMIGSKSIVIAMVLAIISAITSTTFYFVFKKNKHTVFNLILACPLPVFFLFMYLLAKITSGA